MKAFITKDTPVTDEVLNVIALAANQKPVQSR